jgi:hypothetical protein
MSILEIPIILSSSSSTSSQHLSIEIYPPIFLLRKDCLILLSFLAILLSREFKKGIYNF